MVFEPLLRIGEFSRASSLSIKTLRAYHETGLLVPAAIDRDTGYRSYTVGQLTDAAIIRGLRELDVPLEQIRTVLAARDPAVTHKVLAEHGAVLEARLATIQHQVDELYRALEAPAIHTPAERRFEPAQIILRVSGTVNEDSWLPFLERAHGVLHDAARAAGCVITGSFGGCYPTQLEDDAQDVDAYLPIEEPSLLPASSLEAGVSIDELPGTDVAVLTHHGSYDGVVDTYRHLGAWVAEHADPADLPVREIYVVGATETDDVDALHTEILWPIRPRQEER
jgi:DNA-binding transcriptional MerR regulator/effector-binding domain-containing protein